MISFSSFLCEFPFRHLKEKSIDNKYNSSDNVFDPRRLRDRRTNQTSGRYGSSASPAHPTLPPLRRRRLLCRHHSLIISRRPRRSERLNPRERRANKLAMAGTWWRSRPPRPPPPSPHRRPRQLPAWWPSRREHR